MLSYKQNLLLSKQEIDDLWNSVHSLWSCGFLTEKSGKVVSIQRLMACQDGQISRPSDDQLLDTLRDLADQFLEDDSWLLFIDDPESLSGISDEQYTEIDSSQQMIRNFRAQLEKLR